MRRSSYIMRWRVPQHRLPISYLECFNPWVTDSQNPRKTHVEEVPKREVKMLLSNKVAHYNRRCQRNWERNCHEIC